MVSHAKHTLIFENALPTDLVYPKADLDEVIDRLTALNNSMASRRGAARRKNPKRPKRTVSEEAQKETSA
jgi:hypothetical protein